MAISMTAERSHPKGYLHLSRQITLQLVALVAFFRMKPKNDSAPLSVATELSSGKRALRRDEDCPLPLPQRRKNFKQSLPSPSPSHAGRDSEGQPCSEESDENDQEQEQEQEPVVGDQERNEGDDDSESPRTLTPPGDPGVVAIATQLASTIDYRPDQANDPAPFEILRAYFNPEFPAAFYRNVAAALQNRGQHVLPLAAPQLLEVFEERRLPDTEHGDQLLLGTLASLSNNYIRTCKCQAVYTT